MMKLFLTGLLVTATSFLWAQKTEDIINVKEVGWFSEIHDVGERVVFHR